MHRGIYINQHDIREYGAKLQMDYAISIQEENQYKQIAAEN